jgi:hypothetical protein
MRIIKYIIKKCGKVQRKKVKKLLKIMSSSKLFKRFLRRQFRNLKFFINWIIIENQKAIQEIIDRFFKK